MKPEHVKDLALIPRVLRALDALAAEREKVQRALQRSGIGAPRVEPGPKNEYAVASAPNAVMEAARTHTEPPNPALAAAKAERKAWLAKMKEDAIRAEKLRQFAPPAAGEDVAPPEVRVEELPNISEGLGTATEESANG